MNALPLAIFLAGVIWAITQSAKRLMTVLWIVGSIAVVIGLLWVLSLAMPYGAGVLGHAAAFLVLVIPAVVGVGHARAHRRTVSATTPPS
jgi:hypothetical protein